MKKHQSLAPGAARRHTSSWAGLSALSFASLLGGCHDSSASIHEAAQADTVIAREAHAIAANLGQGWDTASESFRVQCVRSPTPRKTGLPTGHVLADTTVSISEVEKELNLDISVKGRYKIVDASLAAKLATSLKTDERSEVFVFQAEYNLGSEQLDESNLVNTPIADAAQASLTWEESCGNEVVYQIDSGARFYFVQRLDFSSREEKQRFEAEANVKAGGLIASGELKTKLNQVAQRFAKTAHMSVEMFQFGGDPKQLGTIFAGSNVTTEGAHALVNCNMTNLEACHDLRVRAVAYTGDGPNGLKAQLSNTSAAQNPVRYITKPWRELQRTNVPRLVDGVRSTREQLQKKFDEIMQDKVRVARLLALANTFGLPGEQVTELNQISGKLDQTINQVRRAVAACYDNLKFDAQGRITAAATVDCETEVAAVSFVPVSDELLTAVAGYAIGRKWNQLGGGSIQDPRAIPLQHLALPGVTAFYKQLTGDRRIYWSPDTDAHEVTGGILSKYDAAGGAALWGLPLTDEVAAGRGRASHFQRASIYWTEETGAHLLNGGIKTHWEALGGVDHWIGFPTTDELAVGDGRGRYNHFEGGSIFWTPTTGARMVTGAIRTHWENASGPRGSFGYPLSDEIQEEAGAWRHNDFEGGAIYWNESFPGGAIVPVEGEFWTRYSERRAALGRPAGRTQDLQVGFTLGGAKMQQFIGGGIYLRTGAARGFTLTGDLNRHYVATALPNNQVVQYGLPTGDDFEVRNHQGVVGRRARFEQAEMVSGPLGTFVVGTPGLYDRAGGPEACGFPVEEHRVASAGRAVDVRRIQRFQNGTLKVLFSGQEIIEGCRR